MALLLGAGLVAAVVVARLQQGGDSGTASWDASRASGFVGYLLLWLSVATGIGAHMRFRSRWASGTLLLEVHRITSVLALAFVAAHVLGLLLDPVVHFAPIDGFVPFTSAFRPVQVGLGTVAEWLLVIILATTALAGRMPYTTWRQFHLLSFPCYALAVAHGVTSGTSSDDAPALTLYALTAGVVAALAVARIAGRGWVVASEA